MPGKYSHSVVLADYSTRGLIVLPPDQHDKYLESAPKPQKKPHHEQQRPRSAQAIYKPPTSTVEGWESLLAEKPNVSLSTDTTPLRVQANISTGHHETRPQASRDLRYYERLSYSSPAVNVVRPPETKTAYQRQQQRVGAASQVHDRQRAYNDITVPEAKSQRSNPAARLLGSALWEAKPNAILREPTKLLKKQRPQSAVPVSHKFMVDQSRVVVSSKEVVRAKTRNSFVGDENQLASLTDQNQATDTVAEIKRNRGEGTLTPDIWRCPLPDSQDASNGSGRTTPEIWRCEGKPSTNLKTKPAPVKALQISKIASTHIQPTEISRVSSAESKGSQDTRIWAPCPILEEPNFDGFLDTEVTPPSDYFEVPKVFLGHRRDSSTNLILPIQRPESREGPRAQTRSGSPITVHSLAGSPPARNRNTPSMTTASSATASTWGVRTDSSASSFSASNGYSQSSTSRKRDGARSPVGSSAFDHKLYLPEIHEDRGFSPSIFEDREGERGASRTEFDLEGSIGQIASGKDMVFDNDTASEFSAALPPPISRFKDEEDEFNANMAKLFGESGDYMAMQKGDQGYRRQSLLPKKSKGLFSMFRSKA
ncbi:hypothetical protein LTS08_002102 [Lithohypha guttulata]|nr:hypothetical protein LTS08_002102 [Lithohypha guttulata]